MTLNLLTHVGLELGVSRRVRVKSTITQILTRLLLNHTGLITVFTLPWTERDKTNPGVGRQEGCDAEGEVIQLI